MNEPRRAEALLLIRLRLSPAVTPETVADEVRRSIHFGQPEVQLVYVMEEPPDEQKPLRNR